MAHSEMTGMPVGRPMQGFPDNPRMGSQATKGPSQTAVELDMLRDQVGRAENLILKLVPLLPQSPPANGHGAVPEACGPLAPLAQDIQNLRRRLEEINVVLERAEI